MTDQKPVAEIFPGCAESLAAVLSRDALAAFCAAFGGQEYRIPENLKPNAPLALHLGVREAERLIRAFGGVRVYVPTLDRMRKRERDDDIRAAHAEGSRLTDIARQYGLTTRQARNICAAGPRGDTCDGVSDGVKNAAAGPELRAGTSSRRT